jgi:uncharacterized protein (TIGR04255 family)
MSETRHLAKAPIREAVIDIQVTPPVSLDALKAIAACLKDKPYKQDEIWQASIGVQINKDGQGTANTDRSPVGYRYTFENTPYALQCQLGRFTFSHLPPYGKWEEMSAIAKELWEMYLEIAKPQAVSRIAVRYLNSLPIPLPITDFADYLNVPPIVPDGLPQSLASFLQRFVMVDNSTGTVAVVTQVLEEILPQSDKITLLLDVDAFKTYPLGFALDTPSIWAILEELRNFKNRVFFSYLTEKTIRMFE